jgi:hypothetical protein
MIYRLYNETEKRYLTDEEMKYLRVNENGEVERLSKDNAGICACSENWLDWLDWQPTPEIKVHWVCPECEGNGWYYAQGTELETIKQRCFNCKGTGWGDIIMEIGRTINAHTEATND